MKTVTVCLLLSTLLSLGNAQTPCSAEVAQPFSFPTEAASNAAGGGGGSGDGGDLTADDLALAQAQAEQALQHDQNLTNLNNIQNDLFSSGGDSFRQAAGAKRLRIRDNVLDTLRRRSLVKKQVDLVCSKQETCFAIEDAPFCANEDTADFHDEEGEGNLNTGSYTLIDGQVGNILTGPFPTLATSPATRTKGAASPSASSTEESDEEATSTPTTGGAATLQATPTNTKSRLSGATAAAGTRNASPSSSSTGVPSGSTVDSPSGASSLRLLDFAGTSLIVLVASLFGYMFTFQ